MLKQMLFKYQGNIGAALILGGVDIAGPGLFTIYPHGSTDKLPYVTMGSGSLAAMAVFEAHWKPEMTREEAIKLVQDAIEAGIFNDLGSGSNVDVTVITKGNTEVLRNYGKPNERAKKESSYKFKSGTSSTSIYSTNSKPEVTKFDIRNVLEVKETIIEPGAVPTEVQEPMDVSA